jgi:AcrR family transcriptional regulator
MPGAKEKPAAKKPKRSAKNGTRLDLTLAAEKVFALNGLHGATLRQIREEAGQKNESVIHYHFGSRDAIIESILHLRSKPMDDARMAMIEQQRSENNGVPLSSWQIARCCILPLAHYLLDAGQAPGYYMRFLVQLRVDRSAWRQFSGLHDQGLNESIKAMREAKPYLPTSILDQRFVSMMYMHLNGMAAIEQIQGEKPEQFRREEAWIRVQDLIATAAAFMDAPLSPETVTAIQSATASQPMDTYTDVALRREQSDEDWPLRH